MRFVSGAQLMQESFDRAVARFAETQHGVVSRAQAGIAGGTRHVIRRRVESGRWLQPARDAFVVAGSPPSWRQDLLVACFAWGDDTAASHAAAAALASLAGFPPGPIELTVPRNRRRTAAPGVVHAGALPRRDITVIDGIPVTTPSRTLIDLAAAANPDRVEEALDDALRRRLVSVQRLRWLVGQMPHRPGVVRMRMLLDQRDGRAPGESVLETRLLRFIRRAGLPLPVSQFPVRDASQRIVARVDFAYPDRRIAIEADGFRWHGGRADFNRDRLRLNRLTLLGWRVIHVTWDDLAQRPDGIAATIAAALS